MSTATLTRSPRIRLATLDEYDQISRVEWQNSLGSLQESDWRDLWLKNPVWPRVKDHWPVGWVLESVDGRIVGTLINVPSLYQFRGRELLCANGRGWAVDVDHRAFALALMGEYFGQADVDLFINTTVGPNAAPLISQLSDRIPCGDFQTLPYYATSHRRLAIKGLNKLRLPCANLLSYPAAAAIGLVDRLRLSRIPSAPRGVTIEMLDHFDARFDPFWQELVARNPNILLSARDSAALNWHFTGPIRRHDLWVVAAVRDGLLRAWCVIKRQDPGEAMRRMRLIDFQTVEPEVDHLAGLLRAALARCRRERYDVLEHLGAGLPQVATFERHAPYRRGLACWPFYYRAVDPALDAELANPELWAPSTYDGDSSYE
ncbi:MAG: hypothetical protein JSS27_03665 [Planctomycetes bacterium]|nr:hypothetical protein [Planctomycetota bacterium]